MPARFVLPRSPKARLPFIENDGLRRFRDVHLGRDEAVSQPDKFRFAELIWEVEPRRFAITAVEVRRRLRLYAR
ncbi:hypothetical protein D3C81_2206680 [compost metagenome]